MNPEGKTALITGGAHRIGKAITLGFAKAGANVVINYNSSASAAEETAAEARTLGVGALPIQADIGDFQQVEAMVSQAQNEFGGIDILVNSASPWIQTPFPMENPDKWHLVTNVLINGSFYCANAVAPLMLENKAGVIINIVDLAAFYPQANFIAHSVGKSALLALNRQLALELAPYVRVNAIAPGPVLPPEDYSEEKIARIAKRTLLNRWGSGADIVEAVLFIVGADYITAEVLAVDGGERFGLQKPGRA